MQNAKIIYVADIFCPWCFAFAPVIKKLSCEYSQFSVTVIGGNLISRPITLAQDIQKNPDLIEFWHEVEHASGRSLSGAINAAGSNTEILLYSPGADEIFTTLKTFKPDNELEQFLYLEELFYGQGKNLFSHDTLNEIAVYWNIDRTLFDAALDQHKTLKATNENLIKAQELMGEITSYPSVLLAKPNKIYAVSRGFVHYETVESRLISAMKDLDIAYEKHKSGLCSTQNGCTSGRH